jgi:hypothetical protein
MTKREYEPYTNTAPCPRCGYPEAIDNGPYQPSFADDELGPVDPEVHMMICGRCGKPFDVAPEAAIERRRQWVQSQHDLGRHQCCSSADCESVRLGRWEDSPNRGGQHP